MLVITSKKYHTAALDKGVCIEIICSGVAEGQRVYRHRFINNFQGNDCDVEKLEANHITHMFMKNVYPDICKALENDIYRQLTTRQDGS